MSNTHIQLQDGSFIDVERIVKFVSTINCVPQHSIEKLLLFSCGLGCVNGLQDLIADKYPIYTAAYSTILKKQDIQDNIGKPLKFAAAHIGNLAIGQPLPVREIIEYIYHDEVQVKTESFVSTIIPSTVETFDANNISNSRWSLYLCLCP
jgi:hypothetical protein